ARTILERLGRRTPRPWRQMCLVRGRPRPRRYRRGVIRGDDVTIATVSVERHDAQPVLHVRGEIEFLNSDAVLADILAAVPPDEPLILDLTQTTHLDSSGVRLLFAVAERLQYRHQRLVLVATHEAVIRRVVALMKLDDQVPLVATVDEALTTERQF